MPLSDVEAIRFKCSLSLGSIKKASLALRIESLLENIISKGFNCMALALSVIRPREKMFGGCCRIKIKIWC